LKKVILTRALYLILFIILSLSSLSIIDADNEASSIDAANSAINHAFTSVLAAENVGGNVTELLLKLNEAGALLAEAENAQRSGIKTNVTQNAEKALLLADQVSEDAAALRDASLLASQNNFWWTLAFSVSGAFIFSVVLFFSWRWFKIRFINRLLDMKPEVVEDTP
jgi:hypothetical protein